MLGNECGPLESSTPFWPYQCLPRSSLAELIALVFLVWWAGALPFPTMALHVPADAVWLVWILLPIPTNPPIWVGPGRQRPLPIPTTAVKGHTLDQSVCYMVL
jgi:hypothetical protein